MLADSAEAAGRVVKDPNKEAFRQMVKEIVDDKVGDGQLDECDLTLADLSSVADSFAQVLAGVYHSRIEYPETLDESESEEDAT